MAAGTKYNLTPDYKPEELYRVETGVRKSGPWKLEIDEHLEEGTVLPVFTPVEANFEKRTIVPVRNVKVSRKFESGTTVEIEKNSLAYVGMHIGDGEHGATISKIDKSKPDHDELTIISEGLSGATIEKGTVLFEAKAVDGTTKKNTANFVLYDAKKVEKGGPVLCTLLMQAYEVKESKLELPVHDLDKAGLTSRFQFE